MRRFRFFERQLHHPSRTRKRFSLALYIDKGCLGWGGHGEVRHLKSPRRFAFLTVQSASRYSLRALSTRDMAAPTSYKPYGSGCDGTSPGCRGRFLGLPLLLPPPKALPARLPRAMGTMPSAACRTQNRLGLPGMPKLAVVLQQPSWRHIPLRGITIPASA